jgi:hypothetical protein
MLSSITYSSSAQTALGILRACYVSWLLPGLKWNGVPFQSCDAPSEDEQIMLGTCRGP